MFQSAHEGRKDKSEQHQQIATEIERRNEKGGDDHPGGAVDHR
jgi:hypothetical protein